MLRFFFNVSFMDVAEPSQLGMQDPATPVMGGIISFHNHLMVFLVAIAGFVGWVLYFVLKNYVVETEGLPKRSYKASGGFSHATVLEIVWTIVPAIILLIIAVPSFSLLYSIDEALDPSLTIKIVGHQWYWSYEYSDYLTDSGDFISFDSYMLPEDDLKGGSFRLLEVDNRVIVPFKNHIRLLVTAADVLHSWAIPSFGVKVDAIPGRLSQASLYVERVGVFYGQCSEICGVNHGFMPIVVRSVNLDKYVSWIASRIDG